MNEGSGGDEESTLDNNIEKGGLVVDGVAAVGGDIAQAKDLYSLKWAHRIGKLEYAGLAIDGYLFVRHPDTEHTVELGLSLGGLWALANDHPYVAAGSFVAKLAWGGLLYMSDEQDETYRQQMRMWHLQNMLISGINAIHTEALREVNAEIDRAQFEFSDEFQTQGCWLLGGHDSITEERTRWRDVGGGWLIDGVK